MHDAESVSLRRATLLLVAASLLRLGSGLALRSDDVGGADVVREHAEATGEVVAEQARRRAPLGPDERIDPNRADEAELDRLPGVGPATAAAIVVARDSGVVFRKSEDLSLVKGVGPGLVSRIGVHLDLARPPAAEPVSTPPRPSSRRSTTARVDVNTADAATLRALPGIGPALARRIIETRRAGPFRSVDDLQRVPGIGPATVERLRRRAIVSRSSGEESVE
jgi:competence ComEA-like helix-hairpin-helix protein